MNLEVVSIYQPETHVATVFFCTESITNLGLKLWNMVPVNEKFSESLNVFKSNTEHQIIVRAKSGKPVSVKVAL